MERHLYQPVEKLMKYFLNNIAVRFQALVHKHLHCSFIGGTLFLLQKDVKQDFRRNTISLFDDKHKVMATRYKSTLPIQLIMSSLIKLA